MKKIIVVLAVLFIGILLAGCTSQPATPVTPTPTPVPTAAPTTVVTTVAPTPVVTKIVTPNVTATPTAVPTPVPTYVITFTQDGTVVPGVTAYIKAGTRVIWQDNDPYKDHALQSTGVQSGAYFGTGLRAIPTGGNYSTLFDKVGSYDYTTMFQPEQSGKIVVT